MLARHAGEMITQETAIAIVRELFPDVSYSPELFGQGGYQGYTFQCESFAEALAALHQLHLRHYVETEKYRAGIPMNPDYKSINERERAGGMLQFTARSIATGELVGSMRVYINPSLHTQNLICTEDVFYVVPEHRGGFMAVRLWQFVEDCVVRIVGVKEIYFDSKLVNKADVMAKYLKYTPIATKFAKVFN